MIRRSTWILVAVFVAVLLVALYMQRSDQQAGAQATPTAGISYLFEDLDADIQRLRISSADGNAVEAQAGLEGAWTLVEPSGQAADTDRIASAASQVQNLRIVSALENPPAAGEVGLEPADYRLSVLTAGGLEQVALIGDETPIQTGYYARREGGPVVVVLKSAVDSLIGLLETPPVLVTPTPTGESENSGTGTPEGSPSPEATTGP
jgi:hypothetical protein